MRVPLGKGDYERSFARAAALKFINRMYEQSPQNRIDQVALISRPGSTFEEQIGLGPIRALFTSPGMFGGDLFIVSGEQLYKKSKNGPAVLTAGSEILLLGSRIRVAGARGAGYERLFISDESNRLLMFQATGTNPIEPTAGDYTSILSIPSSPAYDVLNTDKVGIDGVYYIPVRFQADLNVGSPTGSLSKPWRVWGGDAGAFSNTYFNSTFIANLSLAINADGTPGVHYTTALVLNPRAIEIETFAGSPPPQPYTLKVANRVPGTPNPPISVSVAGITGAFWSEDQLAGDAGGGSGGSGPPGMSVIATPDNFTASAVAELGSHILVLQAGSQRVYFIRPGEITIDALDFFEAESDTDNLVDLVVVGDQLWLMGEKSIEPWFLSGSLDPIASPFEPAKGQAVSIGAIPGTVVNHDGRVFFVGSDQNAYELAGGFNQISNPGISERIRRALLAQEEI